MPENAAQLDAVKAANRSFYDAFESLKFERMAAVWATDAPWLACVHPGWPPLNGWEEIAESWRGILQNTNYIEFNLTDVHVLMDGKLATVFCVENATSGVKDRVSHFSVAAMNVFLNFNGQWRLVAHHSSSAQAVEEEK